MPRTRIPALAIAADLVAVVVFAAIGRASHAEPADLLGLLATIAPFAVGAVAARAVPAVRSDPAGWPAGITVVGVTAGVGLLLRLLFTGDLPTAFVVVTVVSLTVLMLGWRTLAAAVARRVTHRVR